MARPTLIVLTDRNNLDEQLFGTVARCQGLRRHQPVQAKDRADLRRLRHVASSGVVVTTVQKCFPDEKRSLSAPVRPAP
jgi:type I restriction enzyme R subunit